MTGEVGRVQALVRQLVRAPRVQFPPVGRGLDCPPQQGVYLIRDAHGRVLHVGRTTRARKGLVDRLRGHLGGRSSFVVHYLDNNPEKLRAGFTYAWIVVPNHRLRALVEALATGQFCPAHIGTGESARP